MYSKLEGELSLMTDAQLEEERGNIKMMQSDEKSRATPDWRMLAALETDLSDVEREMSRRKLL